MRAEIADSADEAFRGNEHAVGARDGLEEEGADGICAFELDRLVNPCERDLRRVPAALDAVIRIENVHDARHAGLRRPAAWIARERNRAGRAAMIRTVE